MPNPYFTNTRDLLPNTRARAGDVEANLDLVEAGFNGVKDDIDSKAPISVVDDLALKAPIASPVFTGDPRAPTAPDGDNDTSIANTAFVQRMLALAASINLPPVSGQEGKFLSVVGGVPAWALARLSFSEVTGTSSSITNGQHLGLRNAAITTITAPPSAQVGDVFAVSIENGRADNVINWNGLKHMGISDSTTTLDATYATLVCEYHGAAYGWKIY